MPKGIFERKIKVSEETRQKMRNRMLGKKFSEQTKEKMRKSATNPSKETRRKMSLAHQGEKAPNWQGGLTLLNKTIRECFRFRLWRSDIYTRDGFQCVFCGRKRRSGDRVVLNADHIKPFSLLIKELCITSLEQALDCEELWDINNGRTLCEECHRKTETYGRNIRYKN